MNDMLENTTIDKRVEELFILIAIFAYDNNKKEFTISELSSNLKINRTHPYFINIFKFMLENQMIEIIKIIGVTKILKINKIKIRDFVDELPLVKIINEEYNSRYHFRPY